MRMSTRAAVLVTTLRLGSHKRAERRVGNVARSRYVCDEMVIGRGSGRNVFKQTLLENSLDHIQEGVDRFFSKDEPERTNS